MQQRRGLESRQIAHDMRQIRSYPGCRHCAAVSAREPECTMTPLPNQLTDRPGSLVNGAPVELIRDVLTAVRLNGAIFLRAEYTAPWAYTSPPSAVLTRILRPSAKRLILFHIIAEGSCWISVDRERLQASAGDVIVIPYAE